MTQSPEIPTPFAPLPVRARGTLEIFDTSFKLFRRYAGVLLAWSLVSGIVNLVPVVGWMAYLFTMPLMYGAVSCAVAGAVRGQNVSFKQIWGFTKPRYGALLGVLILACILLSVVMFAITFASTLLTFGLAALASSYGTVASVFAWVVGTIIALVVTSLLLAVAMGWFNLAPIITCLEDANRGSTSLSKAWSLLTGNWRKGCAVATILTLMGSAAFFIVGGFTVFLVYGGWNTFLGLDNIDTMLSGLGFSAFVTVFLLVWMPIQTVVGAVFYLDLRTRKEALDLEWTNYAAKPEVLPNQMQPQSAPAYAPPAPTMSLGPPYAPASSMSASPQVAPTPPAFIGQPTVPSPVVQPPVIQSQAPAVPVAADSFSDFAAQVAAPSSVPPAPPVYDPTQGTVTMPSAPQPQPPAVPSSAIEPAFAPTAQIPIEVPTPPVPEKPAATAPIAPTPVQTPSVVPPQPPAIPAVPAHNTPEAPRETSSFAPPPRFRRAASEDDDNPSSFGGGGR